MNDFLAKPVQIGDLERCLKKWLPADKVVETEVMEATSKDYGIFNNFKIVDVSVGLSYTNGDGQMYSAILKDFAATISDKKALINRLADAEDIGRFTIEVHSLKSGAKTIGATELWEQAKDLEAACKTGDRQYVDSHHGEFAIKYRAVSEAVRKTLEEI